MIRKLYSSKKDELPIEINLSEVLNSFEMDQKTFIDFCVLSGCDYTKTLPNIGPKTAMRLLKEHKNIESVIEHLKNDAAKKNKEFNCADFNYKDARDLFVNADVINIKDLSPFKWAEPNEDKIMQILVEKNGFNGERVKKQLERLKKIEKHKVQKRIEDFFGPPIKKTSSIGKQDKQVPKILVKSTNIKRKTDNKNNVINKAIKK